LEKIKSRKKITLLPFTREEGSLNDNLQQTLTKLAYWGQRYEMPADRTIPINRDVFL
jgi:hypothetical protein